jgi:hypothetical protein
MTGWVRIFFSLKPGHNSCIQNKNSKVYAVQNLASMIFEKAFHSK